MTVQGRRLAVLGIAASVLCFSAIAFVVWRAQRTLGGAERVLAEAARLDVDVRAVAAQPNPGFEALSAPAVFKSAASFGGRLYLAGPAGLFAYALDGTLEHIYRTGLDLPAAPLGTMRVGTLADAREPELLIATGGEGVLAFDGHGFRQIRPRNAEARQVTALEPLSSGRLLMGTAKLGLLVWDGKTLSRFHATTNTAYITAIEGTEAELWVGTLDRGVLHWRGGQTDVIGEAEGLPDARVESLAVDGERVFVGTPVGAAELGGGRVQRVLAAGRYARSLLVDGEDLLVGQGDGGVLKVALGGPAGRLTVAGAQRNISFPQERMPAGEAVEQVLAVGDAHYAVTGSGLMVSEPDGGWRTAVAGGEHLLTDRDVSQVMVASDGRVWVGYFDRGLDILAATGSSVTHVEDERIFCVNRIVEDAASGTVAVGTANGLVVFGWDGKQKQVLTKESGLIADHVTDVAIFAAGMVAATPAGITYLDETGAHSLYAFEGLVNNHVYALVVRPGQAASAPLMVGTLGGISVLQAGLVERNLTTGNSGLKANWITGIVPLASDWLVGTYGGGVMRMDAGGQVMPTEATRTGIVVNPLAMAADGQVTLAGTLGQGLLVGDATGTRWHTVTAGLPSSNVTAVAIDRGVVYVGTDNGLVRIAESKLSAD